MRLLYSTESETKSNMSPRKKVTLSSQKGRQKRNVLDVSERQPRVRTEYRDLLTLTKFANLMSLNSEIPRELNALEESAEGISRLMRTGDAGEQQMAAELDAKVETKRNALLAPLWKETLTAFPSDSPYVALVPRYAGGGFPFQYGDQAAKAVDDTRRLLLALINARRLNRTSVELPPVQVRAYFSQSTGNRATVIGTDNFVLDFAVPAMRGRDVRKLGVCPRKRCGRFFVRERKDQKACSARCANALRQHKRIPFEMVERETGPNLHE